MINCLFSIGKKESSGVCGVEMWKKSTVGIPQFPSLPLKSCSSEVCSIAAIKSGAVAVVAFFFRVGVFLTFIREGLLERRNYQPAVCERKDREVLLLLGN